MKCPEVRRPLEFSTGVLLFCDLGILGKMLNVPPTGKYFLRQPGVLSPASPTEAELPAAGKTLQLGHSGSHWVFLVCLGCF